MGFFSWNFVWEGCWRARAGCEVAKIAVWLSACGSSCCVGSPTTRML